MPKKKSAPKKKVAVAKKRTRSRAPLQKRSINIYYFLGIVIFVILVLVILNNQTNVLGTTTQKPGTPPSSKSKTQSTGPSQGGSYGKTQPVGGTQSTGNTQPVGGTQSTGPSQGGTYGKTQPVGSSQQPGGKSNVSTGSKGKRPGTGSSASKNDSKCYIVQGNVFRDLNGDGKKGGSVSEPWLQGATVMLSNGQSAVTNSTGRFMIKCNKPGTYALKVKYENYKQINATQVTVSNRTVNVRVGMQNPD